MEYEPCLHNGKRPAAKKTSGPDGWEAWLVALAACFINFVMAGLARMSGMLYVALIEIFHTDRKQASLPFSVRSSVRNLLGPIVGILGQKYGVRPVIIVGGVVGTVSAASCFYINDILWMTIVWGVINGVGSSLTTTLPQVVIGQHFNKYRSTASGIAFSGGCIGSFLFPVLIEYLLFTYQLGGTFLIIAGFIMHVIPAALLLKTPSWWNDKKTAETQALTTNCESEQTTNTIEFHHENEVRGKYVGCVGENLPEIDVGFIEPNGTLNNFPVPYVQNTDGEQSFKSKIDPEFLWQNRDLLIKLLTKNFTLQYRQSDVERNNFFPTRDVSLKEIELLLRKLEISASNGENVLNACAPTDSLIPESESAVNCAPSKNKHFTNGSIKSEEVNDEVSVISIHYIAYYLEKLFERDKSDIMQTFSEEEGMNKILENLQELHNTLTSYGKTCSQLPNDSESLQRSAENSGDQSNTFCSHIKTACKLYTKPLFLLICLCRAVHFLTFIPVVTIIVDYAMDKKLPNEDGKFVISALSAGDLMGRLCFGWITDREYLSLPRFMLLVMVLQGAATVTIPIMQGRAAFISSIVIFGLIQGTAFVRHPVLVSRYLGNHEQFIAMGCINLFSGLIGFILPVYIGYFRDTIGSYDGMFYINGTLGAIIGLLWLLEPYLLKLESISGSNANQPSKV